MMMRAAAVATALIATPALAQTYDRQRTEFCKAPELANLADYRAIPSLFIQADAAAAKSLEADAALEKAGRDPYNLKAREDALRLRDAAAVMWWRIDIDCARQPNQQAYMQAQTRAGLARRAAQEEYDRYARLQTAVDTGVAPRSDLDGAYQSLKVAQERMWDAREAEDEAKVAYRAFGRVGQRLPLVAGGEASASNYDTQLMQRNLMTNSVKALKALTAQDGYDRVEADRLRVRIEDLRTASLKSGPLQPPPMFKNASGELVRSGGLPAWPPGTDYQAKRPAVLPILPPRTP